MSKESLIEKMFSAGAHFGYTKSRRHPSVKPYIFGNKNKIEIFDLEKTAGLLEEAKAYIKSLGEKNATVLFLGGKNESQPAVIKAADELDMPYVIGRWIGGTFTNFSQIKKRIDRMNKLKEEKAKGEFSKYTKWEALQIEREIEKLEIYFGGISDMKKLPDAVVVVDSKREEIAVNEARMKHIPLIGILGSDCDMGEVMYPVLGNDSSKKSIEFFISELVESYKEGKAAAPKVAKSSEKAPAKESVEK